jgi:hypothetical protein
LNDEQLELVKTYLLNIQVIGDYTDTNTPLEFFDANCHKFDGGMADARMSEDELKFMINVAEHAERPGDMLMLLGEYFKVVIE